MRKTVFAVLLATTSLCCHALDGHNGIKFNMTQEQLEAMGFICNPSPKPNATNIATCRHMDMTGVAFSVPTKNYEVIIDGNNRAGSILAELVGIRSLADYLGLLTNISGFFPKKDETRTKHIQGTFIRDAWLANNNAGIAISYFPGIKPVTKDEFSVIFQSPSVIAEQSKKQAE